MSSSALRLCIAAAAFYFLFLSCVLAAKRTSDPPADPFSPLTTLGEGKVASVEDGATVRMEDGGVVRLIGILAPRMAQERPLRPAEPLAEAARAELARLFQGRKVRLQTDGGPARDRYGRVRAHLFREDGLWAEGALLEKGLARFAPSPGDRALGVSMLEREAEAREKKQGLWALAAFQAHKPDELGRLTGSFQIVRGQVATGASVKGRGYLNFGENHEQDFTVVIMPEAMRAFRAAKKDPKRLVGQAVEVRGWLGQRGGPQIEAHHPDQIQRLEADAPVESRRRLSHTPGSRTRGP